MTVRRERGLWELYRDPERADFELWGRRSERPGQRGCRKIPAQKLREGEYSCSERYGRRGFLKGAGLVAMGALVRAGIPMARFMPAGLLPVPLQSSAQAFALPGKNGLIVLNDRPINAETPAHLLDDAVTPAERLFVRNNGLPPAVAAGTAEDWTVEIAGEACESPRTFSVRELKTSFEHRTYRLQLECAGNGRSEFYPPATGNQWTTGAIGCPRWTGVRLRDVLESCGIAGNAVYVAYEGADRHLATPDLLPISRGVPMSKALEDESLLVWAMNGRPLAALHGFPLRLVLGGWPASVSGKWIKRLLIRDRIHDGEKMLGQSYRVPCEAVAPGTVVPDDRMCIIHSMPVKSLATYPESGIDHPVGEPLSIRGHAWAGDLEVVEMRTSIDFGATWQAARLEPPANRLAWQRWSARVRFPVPGYYEVWARAMDAQGRSQPMLVPGWNPRGYLNNACHRIAVLAV